MKYRGQFRTFFLVNIQEYYRYSSTSEQYFIQLLLTRQVYKIIDVFQEFFNDSGVIFKICLNPLTFVVVLIFNSIYFVYYIKNCNQNNCHFLCQKLIDKCQTDSCLEMSSKFNLKITKKQ